MHGAICLAPKARKCREPIRLQLYILKLVAGTVCGDIRPDGQYYVSRASKAETVIPHVQLQMRTSLAMKTCPTWDSMKTRAL